VNALVDNSDAGMCCTPTLPSTSESSAAEAVDSITIHLPSYQLIKWIPCAVRNMAAKGGHRITLSSRILAQLVAFNEGAPDSSTAVNPWSMLREKPVWPDLLDFDKQAAHRALIRLDAGD